MTLIDLLARQLVEDQVLDIRYRMYYEAVDQQTFTVKSRQTFRDAVGSVLVQKGKSALLDNLQWQNLHDYAVRWFLLDATRLRKD